MCQRSNSSLTQVSGNRTLASKCMFSVALEIIHILVSCLFYPEVCVILNKLCFASLGVCLLGISAAGVLAQDVLRVGTTALPPSLGNPFRTTGAPHSYTWSATFDGLTRIDQMGALQPWLATGWELRDDNTWVVRLRDDVVFSNGVPLTADAVVEVVAFLTSDASAREAVAREFQFLKTARAVDAHTVEIVTHSPTAHLPRVLPILYMVEPDQWRRLGPEGFAREPIGTGPYHPTNFSATRIQYQAVPSSWRKPLVPQLEIIAAPEAYTRTQAVIARQLDIALILGPEETDVIEAAGGVGMSWPTAALQSISFHHGKGTPLDDVKVREALNLAIDRRTLIDGLLAGIPEPATQPGVSNAYGFNDDLPPIPYDPDRARALLAEAGYPDGFSFTVQGAVGSGPNDAAIYQLIAQYLAAIGVEMEIRTFPITQLIRGVMEGNWDGDAFVIAFAMAPTLDVLRITRNHSCLWAHPWYCNESIMPAVNEAMTTLDEQRGIELRHDIMQHYREDWAALYLYQLVRFAGMQANVRGFSEVNDFVSFEKIHFVDE